MRYLLLLCCCLGTFCRADSVAERWLDFSETIRQQKPALIITSATLRQFPKTLLYPDVQYPDLEHYSWSELEALYQFHQSCHLPKEKNGSLNKAWQFESALCKKQHLDLDWFKHGEVRHPAGGSYAERYLAAHPKISATLQQNLRSYLAIREKQHPLYATVHTLNDGALQALLKGAPWVLDQNRALWFNSHTGLLRYEQHFWGPLAQNKMLSFTPLSPQSECVVSLGELCINPRPSQSWLLLITLGTFVLLSFLWVAHLLWQRRLQQREQRFILQLLTHELRTPITSLALTIEQFRMHYDSLPSSLDRSFTRLLSDNQRLQQLSQTSRGYLSLDKNTFLECDSVQLFDWLNYHLSKFDLKLQQGEAITVKIPSYWLGLCLDNLLQNAINHGAPPVVLLVDIIGDPNQRLLRLCVQDSGTLPASTFFGLRQAKSSNKGMGMGLFLVRRIMDKMGGRLRFKRSPSQFILEYPL